MGKPDLRVIGHSSDATPSQPKVRVKLSRLFPLLQRAHRQDYVWLQDMADDELIISQDLAEIVLAFETIQQERKGA